MFILAGHHGVIGDPKIGIIESISKWDGQEPYISIIWSNLWKVGSAGKFYINYGIRCWETVRVQPPFPSDTETEESHVSQRTIPEALAEYLVQPVMLR